MHEITSKPFQESHLDIFRVAEAHRDACWGASKIWHQLGTAHQAGTHMLDGRILYISGYLNIMPGVVELWMHPSIYVPGNRIKAARHVKWWIGHIAREQEARRVQTWGDCSEEADRWLTFLGFKCEGVLESYGPDGKSASIWGMVCKH